MIVLITGHLGFIGSNLKSYLEKQNYQIIGLDLKRDQDILFCDLPECDLVIHLAAKSGVRQSIKDPETYWNINVNGTRRILEHYKNTRVLVASSSSQYEPHLNPYAASKHVMEKIPHDNVCWMRFHTVYSDTPREDMFLHKLFNGTLEYVTDHERDFIHVTDVCRAIEILINNDYIGPIDIGTGITTKISSLSPTLPIKTETSFERKRTCADISVLRSFGFEPMIKLSSYVRI